jgi:mono/diheme cytochrome c family protein
VRRLAAVALAACGGASYSGPIVAPTRAGELAAGSDVGLVMLGGVGYAFEPRHVSVLRGARVVARTDAPGPAWTSATALTGPDGERWAVGLANGGLWRVTITGELEPVGARLGIGDARVLAIDASGTGFAIGLAGGVAFSRDGAHLERLAGGDVTHVAIAGARVAASRDDALEVFDLERGTRVVYPVERSSAVAFTDPPGRSGEPARLVVAAGGTAYAEDRGVLQRIPAPGQVRELAVSGPHIWLVARDGLFSYDQRGLIERISGLPAAAHIHRAAASDVWVSQAGRSIRYSLDAPTRSTDWQTVVAPVFQRACAKCHLADGPADLDLSTAADWASHAAVIRHMVDTQAMPPAGASISDADRATLQRWLMPLDP